MKIFINSVAALVGALVVIYIVLNIVGVRHSGAPTDEIAMQQIFRHMMDGYPDDWKLQVENLKYQCTIDRNQYGKPELNPGHLFTADILVMRGPGKEFERSPESDWGHVLRPGDDEPWTYSWFPKDGWECD